MNTLQYTVAILASLNLLVFVVMGRFYFDQSFIGPRFWAFAGVFMVLAGFTLRLLYLCCTEHWVRLAMAACTLLASMLVYLATVVATSRHPFTAAFSSDKPTRFVNTDIYALVRHPFYTSYILTFAGAAVATDHIMGLVIVSVIAAIYWAAARLEEKKFSASDFAADYAAYKASTGMFIPRIKSLVNSGPVHPKVR